MNTRLIVLIEPHWPIRPSAAWVLLDEGGRIQSEGTSEPRHWPAAAECAIVLAGSQCAWHRARLPRGARREEARLLAYALEDRLLSDPDSLQLTVTRRDSAEDGTHIGVLVTARERLRAVVAQLAAIGRPPVAAWSELQCAPADTAGWHLSIAESALILRSGPDQGEVLDPPIEAAAPLLQQALATARAANLAPTTLTLHLAPGTAAPTEGDFAVEGIECVLGTPYLWWQGHATASNLLHTEFSPRHQRDGWLARLRWPLRLVAASLAALMVANLGDVLWKRHQLGALEHRMNRIFQTAVPNTPAIAPAAQLRRQLDLQRERLGRLREDDMLALLAAYGEARGVAAQDSVVSLIYRESRLDIDLAELDAADRNDLPTRLAALGYRASVAKDATRLSIAAEVTR